MNITIKPWLYDQIYKEMSTYNRVPISEEVVGGYSIEVNKILDHSAKAYKIDMCYYKRAYGLEIDMNVYHGWVQWIPTSAVIE